MLVYCIGLTTPIVKLLDSSWPGGGVTLMLPFCAKMVAFGKQENLMLFSSNACPKQILLTPEKEKHFLYIYFISKAVLIFILFYSKEKI